MAILAGFCWAESWLESVFVGGSGCFLGRSR